MRNIFKDDNGFTFLEMMIALALSSLILVMTYMAQKSIITKVSRMSEQAESVNELTASISCIENDFASIYMPSSPLKAPLNSDYQSQFGLKQGDVVTFYAIDRLSIFPVRNDSLCDNSSDIKIISYSLDQSANKYQLNRKVRELTDPENSYKSVSRLIDNITSVKIEFFTDGNWTEKWNSNDTKKYPRGIRLAFQYEDSRGTNNNYLIVGYPGMNSK